ncbi:MAG: 5-bromo-4-chloroindolyl phosphate hydrolysis family protein [Rhodobacteraceae bacterium]|nr:5-bromo-4-chloroindolyl phosphate hydrolysis family protein [Paracoccaceae bacterium]
MAERFRGPHSPEGPARPAGPPQASRPSTTPPPVAPPGSAPPQAGTAFRGARVTRAGARANFLFLAPAPFLVTAFFQPPTGLALDLAAFGALVLAAWLTREGLIAEDAYAARTVARRPAIPRKLFASALTGAGLALGGYAPGAGIFAPAIFAVLGSVLHGLAFGLDPMRDKGAEGIDPFQSDRVARAVEEAERHLAAMSDAIRRAGDRGLEARVERFQAAAREMFRQVENDPRDLTAARRYLSVYLLGARDATVRFADLYARSREPGARADYEALLADLEANFAAQSAALMQNDRAALDVEIEVLRERLGREGVRPQ